MATFIPSNPHFFQPLFPGFEHQFSIPTSFYKFLKGQACEKATLRSPFDQNKLWHVKIKGRKFEDGWKEFVHAHDLHIGYFLVFEHVGNMVFDVLVFDLSACQKKFPNPFNVKQERIEFEEEEEEEPVAVAVAAAEEQVARESTSKKSKQKKVNRASFEASAEFTHPYFEVTLTSSKQEKLPIPMRFARLHNLNNRCCKMHILDQEDRTWPVNLFLLKSRYPQGIIGRGWTACYNANSLKRGDSLIFQLLENGEEPVFKLSKERIEIQEEAVAPVEEEEEAVAVAAAAAEEEEEEEKEVARESTSKKSKQKKVNRTSFEASAEITHPYFEVTLTSSKQEILPIPARFARIHNLNNRCCKILILDQEDRPWPVNLFLRKSQYPLGIMGRGWTACYNANSLKRGDLLIFQLVENGELPVFKLSKERIEIQEEAVAQVEEEEEEEEEKVEEEDEEEEEASAAVVEEIAKKSADKKSQKKKRKRTAFEASNTEIEHPYPYFEKTLTSFSSKRATLPIPLRFSRLHNLHNTSREVFLLDPENRTWPVKFWCGRSCDQVYIGIGWSSCRDANGLKGGDSLIFQLIQNRENLVFKFSKKLNMMEKQPMANLEAKACSSLNRFKKLKPMTDLKAKASSAVEHPEELKKQQQINNLKADTCSTLEDSYLEINLTSSSFSRSRVYIRENYVKLHNLGSSSNDIILMDQEGRSWPAKFYKHKRGGYIYGWKAFHAANDLKLEETLSFKLIEKRNRTIFKLCKKLKMEKLGNKQLLKADMGSVLEEEEEEEEEEEATEEEEEEEEEIARKSTAKKSKNKKRKRTAFEASNAQIEHPCFEKKLTSSICEQGRLPIPMEFARLHNLHNRSCEAVLLDPENRPWPVKFQFGQSDCQVYFANGWSSCCASNGLKGGESLIFHLIRNGESPVFRFSKERIEIQGDEEAAAAEEATEEEEEEEISKTSAANKSKNKKRTGTTFEASNAEIELSYPYFKRKLPSVRSEGRLPIPKGFARLHNLHNISCEVVLLDPEDRSWPVKFYFRESCHQVYISKGWRSCRVANGLKGGESLIFHLIRNGESPMFIFSKMEQPMDLEAYFEAMNNSKADTNSDIEDSYLEINWRYSSFQRYQFIQEKYIKLHNLRSRSNNIILMDQEGRNWPAKLYLREHRGGTIYGWRAFHAANDLSHEWTLFFKLAEIGNLTEFKLCKKLETEKLRNKPQQQMTSSSVLEDFPLEINLTSSSFSKSRVYIKEKYVKLHSLRCRSNDIILMDQEGRDWPAKLYKSRRGGHIYGWQAFHAANDLQPEETLSFKLTEKGNRIVFKLCRLNGNEHIHQGKGTRSSSTRNPYFSVIMDAYSFLKHLIKIPRKFATKHGFNKYSEMIIENEKGESWSVSVARDKLGIFRIGSCNEFITANGLEIGSALRLELVKKRDNKPVLKFYEHNSRGFDDEEEYVSPYFYVTMNAHSFDGIRIPRKFATKYGFSQYSEIIIENEKGESWSFSVARDTYGIFRLRGCIEFITANGIEIGSVFMLELVKKRENKPVMKFREITSL